MNRSTPRLATWLLERFDIPQRKPDLFGDLVEEYRSGRSALWFWWQSFAAIGVALTRDIRCYPKWFVLRAVVTGWAVSYVLAGLYAESRPFLEQHGSLLGLALTFIPVCVGWVVGRTHRAYPGVAALACGGWFLLGWAWTALRNFEQIRNAPVPHFYGAEIGLNLLALTLLVMAGFAGSLRRRKLSPRR